MTLADPLLYLAPKNAARPDKHMQVRGVGPVFRPSSAAVRLER